MNLSVQAKKLINNEDLVVELLCKHRDCIVNDLKEALNERPQSVKKLDDLRIELAKLHKLLD